MEARDAKQLLRLQRQLAKVSLLIIDELGLVPLRKTGAELLFELISQRYERGLTLIAGNLPFEEWTEPLDTEGSIRIDYVWRVTGRMPAAAASIARGVWWLGRTARWNHRRRLSRYLVAMPRWRRRKVFNRSCRLFTV